MRLVLRQCCCLDRSRPELESRLESWPSLQGPAQAGWTVGASGLFERVRSTGAGGGQQWFCSVSFSLGGVLFFALQTICRKQKLCGCIGSISLLSDALQ